MSDLERPKDERLLSEYVRKHAEDNPDKIAVNYYGKQITYTELDDLSDRLGTAISAMGYKKGDFLAAFVQSCALTYVLYIAAMKLGLIIIPIDPMSQEFELEYFLTDSGAQLIATMDSLYPLVAKVKPRCNFTHIITLSFQDYLPESPTFPIHKMMQVEKRTFKDSFDCLELLRTHEANPPKVEVSLSDDAYILYTGGTTGLPKGCLHTHRDAVLGGFVQGKFSFSNASELDVTLSSWPLSHVSGIIFSMAIPFVYGMTVIPLARWDAKAAIEAISKHHVTFALLTTLSYHDMLSHPDIHKYDLTSMRVSLIVAFVMPITEELIGKWEEVTNSPVYDLGYGSSETMNYFGYDGGLPSPRPPCVGRFRLVPGAQLRVEDFETRELLPEGAEGELVIKSPAQLKKYWNKLEENARDIVNGWLHTHDRGYIKDNIVYFMGKESEIVKVSGYTVSLKEVEVFGTRHPAIEQIAAIAVPHPRKGNELKAFVTLKPDVCVAPSEIEEWFKDKIAKYKLPTVEICKKLPLSGKGEVLKRVLIKEELKKRSSEETIAS